MYDPKALTELYRRTLYFLQIFIRQNAKFFGSLRSEKAKLVKIISIYSCLCSCNFPVLCKQCEGSNFFSLANTYIKNTRFAKLLHYSFAWLVVLLIVTGFFSLFSFAFEYEVPFSMFDIVLVSKEGV